MVFTHPLRDDQPQSTAPGTANSQDTQTEAYLDTMAQGVASAPQSDQTGQGKPTAAHESQPVDRPLAPSAPRVRPARHGAMIAASRAAYGTSSHCPNNSVGSADTRISTLDIVQAAHLRTGPKRTINEAHVSDAHSRISSLDIEPAAYLQPGPTRTTDVAFTVEPDIHPRGRPSKRIVLTVKKNDLSREGQTSDGVSRQDSSDTEVGPEAIHSNPRTRASLRSEFEEHVDNPLLAEMTEHINGILRKKSNKENQGNTESCVRATSNLPDQSRSLLQRRRKQNPDLPLEPTNVLGLPASENRNVVDLRGLGYSYGYHVPRPNEDSFYIPESPTTLQESTLWDDDPEYPLHDPPLVTHPLLSPGTLKACYGVPETKAEGESTSSDDWMAGFLVDDKFTK